MLQEWSQIGWHVLWSSLALLGSYIGSRLLHPHVQGMNDLDPIKIGIREVSCTSLLRADEYYLRLFEKTAPWLFWTPFLLRTHTFKNTCTHIHTHKCTYSGLVYWMNRQSTHFSSVNFNGFNWFSPWLLVSIALGADSVSIKSISCT